MTNNQFITFAHKHPFRFFLPLLLCWFVLAFIFVKEPRDDEIRYLTKAQRIIEGNYSPAPHVNLWSGPGYPFVLVPFVYFNIHPVYASLFNFACFYLSVSLLFLILKTYVSPGQAVFFSLLPVLYIPVYAEMFRTLTEPLGGLLVMLTLYFFIRSVEARTYKWVLLSGLSLGYLALTKVVFGWIILLMAAPGLYQFLVKKRALGKIVSFICFIALAVNVPYLNYTNKLTGKFLYWSNSGGLQLYCMSTPYEQEYGSWFSDKKNDILLAAKAAPATIALWVNHENNFNKTSKLNPVAKDEAYYSLAITNIQNHPVKYLQNVICNISRMFVNMPYNYKAASVRDFARIPFGATVFILLTSAFVILVKCWKKIKDELKAVFLFVCLYLLTSSLVSAYPRQLNMMLPALMILIAVATHLVWKDRTKQG